MSNIRIFVSHRIDIDSETVDTPVYFPVRCGAVYDEEGNSEIQGDDTGDNISKLRMSFCEFTVQYCRLLRTVSLPSLSFLFR